MIKIGVLDVNRNREGYRHRERNLVCDHSSC